MRFFMKKEITALLKSSYVKNIVILAGGTGLAQAIGIISSPFTRRIFTPENFGLLALITSIVSLLLPIATFTYEQGIMLPKDNKKSVHLGLLGITLAFFLSLILIILLLFFRYKIALLLNAPTIANWLFVVPFTLLSSVIYLVLYNYNSKLKAYKRISRTQILKSCMAPLVSIPLGLAITNSPLGLILGVLASSIVGIKGLLKDVTKDFSLSDEFKISNIKKVAFEYIKFPKFNLAACFANIASNQVVDIFLSISVSVALLGQYSLAKMLLSLPIAFIGKSVSQVFYQKIVQTKNEQGDCLNVFSSTLKTLIVFSLFIFGIAYFLIEPAINFVYGDQWNQAAKISKLIIPLMAIRFVSSSLSLTLYAYEKQQLNLYINLLMLVTLVVLVATFYTKFDLFNFLRLYVLTFCVEYLLFIGLFYFVIRRSNNN